MATTSVSGTIIAKKATNQMKIEPKSPKPKTNTIPAAGWGKGKWKHLDDRVSHLRSALSSYSSKCFQSILIIFTVLTQFYFLLHENEGWF